MPRRTFLVIVLFVVVLFTISLSMAAFGQFFPSSNPNLIDTGNSPIARALPTTSSDPINTTPLPKKTEAPILSPIATPSPSATQLKPNSVAPTPLADSEYIEGRGWLPYGNFGLVSPTNQTYNYNSITVQILGDVLVGCSPSLSYSLDNNPRIPISLETTLPETQPSMQNLISASFTLMNLTNGSHTIVVYGDLGTVSKYSKCTVSFEIQQ